MTDVFDDVVTPEQKLSMQFNPQYKFFFELGIKVFAHQLKQDLFDEFIANTKVGESEIIEFNQRRQEIVQIEQSLIR